MNAKIENLKEQIESGALAGVLPVPQFSMREFTDMLQINFDSHVGDVGRVRVGQFFKYRPNVVIRYGLNVKMSSGNGVVFTWKNLIKPDNFIEIEHKLMSLYTKSS